MKSLGDKEVSEDTYRSAITHRFRILVTLPNLIVSTLVFDFIFQKVYFTRDKF